MNCHSIENEKILNKTDSSISLEFFIPEECDFFDGHFPGFKLLPAVAQIEIATRFSKKYLGTPRAVKKLRRLKFAAPLFPDTKCKIELSKNDEKKNVTFTISSATNPEHLFSSGVFFYE